MEQPGDEKQRNHGDTEAQPRQREFRQQRNCAFAEAAQIASHGDDAVEPGIHECALIETVPNQGLFGMALRAVVRPVTVGIEDQFGVVFD